MQNNFNSFFPGQRVICIDDKFPLQVLDWASNLPRKGAIYTIRAIGRGPSIYNGDLKFGVYLEELENGRFGFFASRFAPIAEKSDVAQQATTLESIVMQVGNAAMKSLAENVKSKSGRVATRVHRGGVHMFG